MPWTRNNTTKFKQCWYLQFLNSADISKIFESHVSSGMCHGEVLHANAHHFFHRRRRVKKAACEDLLAGFSEVFRQESVKNGVDTGVSIGQAMRNNAKCKGCIIQGKVAELHPHSDNVVRHPADEECSDNQQHRLSCLDNTERERKIGWLIIPHKTWFFFTETSFL